MRITKEQIDIIKLALREAHDYLYGDREAICEPELLEQVDDIIEGLEEAGAVLEKCMKG